MNPKILIEVRGGTIVFIGANTDIRIAIVDWDNLQNGGEAINDICEPDYVSDNLYDMFTKDNREVKEFLKLNGM